MSPITAQPAARAWTTISCGVGKLCGMPGLRISAAGVRQSIAARSTIGMPSACAASRAAAESSQASTVAPPLSSACAAARPERASPSTATVLPAMKPRSIIALPQLQGREADQRQHRGDDPEADDDGRLRPALLLEMMVQRRHAEDAAAGQLERGDLDDHRYGLEHEQPADDHQDQ